MAKLWGGRFSETEMDSRVMKFTSSLSVDKVLAKYDCLSSKVHVEMLAKCGYVSQYERKELIDILDELSQRIEDGTANFEGYEDVHSAIQDYVQTKAPESGKKLHTARSRNEQVVNDVRLYSKDKVEFLMELVRFLQKNLVELAERTQDSIVPGYTHLNRAQPVVFSHLVMAYVEMLDRDYHRLEDARKRMDVSVMGSGALAGSSLKLDRKFVAEKLGFKNISANSIDAVSDRDFMAEVLSALSIIAVHLSRISEDFILYSLPEFGFLEMGSKFCTGSSLMPQKKNPDVLELIRARSAGVISALNSLLVLMKGLPHSYNRDLQEDKGPFFGAIGTVAEELAIMADLVSTIKLRPETAIESLEDEFVYSTDIAEYLVRKGMPFKDAHDVIGRIVKHCIENDIIISDLSIAEMKKFSAVLDEDVFGLLSAEASVNGKKTEGSTNPELVAKEIARWKKLLEKN